MAGNGLPTPRSDGPGRSDRDRQNPCGGDPPDPVPLVRLAQADCGPWPAPSGTGRSAVAARAPCVNPFTAPGCPPGARGPAEAPPGLEGTAARTTLVATSGTRGRRPRRPARLTQPGCGPGCG